MGDRRDPTRRTPIACRLSPTDYRDRTAGLAALAAQALQAREPRPEGERLVFADRPDGERALRAAIAAEALCPFLRFGLERTEGGLVVEITGPPGARPVIAELFA